MRNGHFLWRPDDSFAGLRVVHSGCIMIFRMPPSGEEQVLQFALPGDLIGLEAFATGRHAHYAQALGETSCCRLRWPNGAAATDHPALSRRLLKRASQLLAQSHLQARSNDPIVAVLDFLRELSPRLGREVAVAGQRRVQMRLPMSRLDIGRYLGFAEETVCRAIRRLQTQGLIEARGRQVNLLEAALLPPAARFS